MLAVHPERRRWSMSADVCLHAAAGITAGAISTLCCHPIDSLKTRYQAQDGTLLRRLSAEAPTSSLQAVRAIYRHEGLWAFYQGLGPALLGSACAWGLYFGGYHHLRATLPASLPARNFTAASLAGVLATTLTSPVWLIKTRLQLYPRCGRPPTVSSELRLILQTSGVTGLFRGLGPQLVLVLNPSIQLTLYEALKGWCHRTIGSDQEGKLPDKYLTGCIVASKTVATALTTPLSVIKVRMQDPRASPIAGGVRYDSMWHSVATIYAREGARGFFKGLGPTLLKPLPGALVTFLTYESVAHFLKSHLQGEDAGRRG